MRNLRGLPDHYVEGSFVVSVAPSSSTTELETLSANVAKEAGCQVAAPAAIDWGHERAVPAELAQTYQLVFSGCELDRDRTQAILAGLASDDQMVRRVDAEASVSLAPVASDQTFEEQEHLTIIHRDLGCALSDQAGDPIIVAVVDSGIDVNHPALASRLYRDANGEVIGANFVGSSIATPPNRDFIDQNGHGTHVAGLIAAKASKASDGVGVAGCVNVKIMPVRVLGASGNGTLIEIERGVKWAADQGAHIINLSLSYHTQQMSENAALYHDLYAHLVSRNVVIIASAGNDGYRNGLRDDGQYYYNLPSSYDGVISVAATTLDGTLASFSNRGEKVDVAAPGSEILSTALGGGLVRRSGTSMATPIVTGAYVVAFAAVKRYLPSGRDSFDLNDVTKILQNAVGTETLARSDVLSGGVVDVQKLVSAMKARFAGGGGLSEASLEQTPVPTTPVPTTPVPTTPVPTTPVPTTPVPTTPVPTTVQSQAFAFDGLVDGQKLAQPQSLRVKNLPSQTYAVYFYWGNGALTKINISSLTRANRVFDGGLWHLYGTHSVRAVAVDRNLRTLATAQVSLVGT